MKKTKMRMTVGGGASNNTLSAEKFSFFKKKFQMFGIKLIKAFTLAEVLIILMIIGIIATLTIPTLVKKYQKTVVITQFKDIYSTLSNAFSQAVVEYGPPDTWSGLQNNPVPEGMTVEQAFAEHFRPYLKISKICGQTDWQECLAPVIYAKDKKTVHRTGNDCRKVTYVLENGMVLSFSRLRAVNQIERESGSIWVDINGKKPPNASGYDNFFFSVNLVKSSNLLYGKFSAYDDGLGNQYNRNNLKAGTGGCNVKNSQWGGANCARLIVLDGFRIADDYEW